MGYVCVCVCVNACGRKFLFLDVSYPRYLRACVCVYVVS